MDEAALGIAFVAPGGLITDANPALAHFLGQELADVVGRDWSLVCRPGPGGEDERLARVILAGDQDHIRLTRQFVKGDGSVAYGDVSASAMRDTDGAFQYAVVQVVDQTERTKTLLALQQSEEAYRLMAENASDVVLRGTEEGGIEWISPSVTDLLGWRPDEVKGRRVWTLIHPDDQAAFQASGVELAAGRPARYEARWATADGGWRWVGIAVRPVINEVGDVVGRVGGLRDIEAEVAGRRALRASEELYRSLVEASPDTIALTDVDGTVRFATPDVVRVFRFASPDEPIGRSALGFVVPDERERAATSLREIIEGDPGGVGPYTCIRADGTHFPAEVTGRTIKSGDGTPTGVVLVIRDVTLRNEMEQQLRESEERLAEARRLEALGRLAGGVAHDFNNILMAINGIAEVLADSLVPGDPRHADAVAIRGAGARAAALTAQLLAFGRRQVLRPTVVDLGAVLEEIAPMLRRTIGADVALRLQVEPATVLVRVDRSQLEQVIINLVFNARDAMPQGGAVTIAAAAAVVDSPPRGLTPAAHPGRYARLSVNDTGTGIDAAVLASMFDPFFTTKEHGRGTGLGLATVQGVVAQSGGWIDVDTAVGKGTTFTVYLPIGEVQGPEVPGSVAAAAPQTAPSASGAASRGIVLLVDDDAAVRAICSRLLSGLGFDVLEEHAPDAALALSDDALARLRLIVTDIVMPGMDGTIMAHRLRDRRPGLPVVFMSGHTPDRRAYAHLAEPAATFLSKPFTRDSLAAAIRRLLDE